MTSILPTASQSSWESRLPHLYTLGSFLTKETESTKEKVLQAAAWIFTVVPVLPVIALVWDGLILGLPHLRTSQTEKIDKPDLEPPSSPEIVDLPITIIPVPPERKKPVFESEDLSLVAEPNLSPEPAPVEKTSESTSFPISTLMKAIVAGAAVLTTAAAVWYFRDSIIPRFLSPSSDPTSPSPQPWPSASPASSFPPVTPQSREQIPTADHPEKGGITSDKWEEKVLQPPPSPSLFPNASIHSSTEGAPKLSSAEVPSFQSNATCPITESPFNNPASTLIKPPEVPAKPSAPATGPSPAKLSSAEVSPLQLNTTSPITEPPFDNPASALPKSPEVSAKPSSPATEPPPTKLSSTEAPSLQLNATCPIPNPLLNNPVSTPTKSSEISSEPVREAPTEATSENALIVYPEHFEFPTKSEITPDVVRLISERECKKPFWWEGHFPPEDASQPNKKMNPELVAASFPIPEFGRPEAQVCYKNESSLPVPHSQATSWWEVATYTAAGIVGLLSTYLLLKKRREQIPPVQVRDRQPLERRPPREPLMIEAPREPVVVIQQMEKPREVIVSSAPSFERLGLSIQALERLARERGDFHSIIQVGQQRLPLRISDLIESLKRPFHFKSSQLAAQDLRNPFIIAQADLLESEDVFAYNLPGWPPILVTSHALGRFAQMVQLWTSQLERDSRFVRFSVPSELRIDPRSFVFPPPRDFRSSGREVVLARPRMWGEDEYKYGDLEDEWVVVEDYLSRSIDELRQEVLAPVAQPSRGMVQVVTDFFSGLVYGAATTYQHWYERWIKEFSHPSKAQKYRIHLESMVRNLTSVNLEDEIQVLAEGRESFETPNILLESTIAVLYHLIHPQTPREQYNLVISALRNAIRSEEFKSRIDHPVLNRCRELIRLVSFTRYASTHTVDYVRNVVKLALDSAPPMEYPEELNKNTISAVLECDRLRINAADPSVRKPQYALKAQKASGAANVNFDSGRINCPYVRSSWFFDTPEGDRELIYLRHGTPTIENGLLNAIWATASRAFSRDAYRNAATDPVYEAFLEQADARGENVLYCSHQAYCPSILGDESDRSLAIESNQKRHRCFNFMALPMDGAVSKGTSHDNAGDLKAYIVRSLMRSENGFRLPERILREIIPDRAEEMDIVEPIRARYAHEFAQILDDVHRLYFGGAELNTPQLRQTFLMLSYHHLKMDMIKRFNIKYIVSPCKDNIDRGNASTSVDESIWNLILNLHNDPKALDLLRYQVAGPPYLVKKQGILKNRLVLLTNVLELIATLDPGQIAAIRNYHNDKWKVKDTRVVIEPGQKATPSLETALTREEYEIFVKEMRERQPPPKENPDMIAANLEVYRDQYGLNKARIRDQLEKDLVRTQVILNGCRYVNFEPLYKDVHAAMDGNEKATWTYLCLLQQGSNADVLIDLNKALTSQKVEIQATGKPVSNAQKAIFSLMDFCKIKHSAAYNSKMMLRLSEAFKAMNIHPFDEIHSMFLEGIREDLEAIDIEVDLNRILIHLQSPEDIREFLGYFCKICNDPIYRTAFQFQEFKTIFNPKIRPRPFHITRVEGILMEDVRQIKVATDYVLKSTNAVDQDALFGNILGIAQFDLSEDRAWTQWGFVN